MSDEKKKYDIDTMTGAGKKMNLVGREYVVLPVTIEDMKCIFSDNDDERLFIPDKKLIDSGEISWLAFGANLSGEKEKILIKMISKYVFYKEHPMTRQLLIDHNWSFKEIGTFLYFWIQEVSE